MRTGSPPVRQIGLSASVLLAVLWLQGNLLWHNTAHALHHHEADLLCQLDVLIPEAGTDQTSLPSDEIFSLCMVLTPVFVGSSGAHAPLAYLSRAPPAAA